MKNVNTVGKNRIGFLKHFLKLLGIFNFDLPKVPAAFTFLSEKMLISKIGVFLFPRMLIIDKKNTQHWKCNIFFSPLRI